MSVLGLKLSVTGTLTSRDTTELEGLATTVIVEFVLAANTRGELPIANNAAIAIVRADVTRIGFIFAKNCDGEY